MDCAKLESPFTILIDKQEKSPFVFDNLRSRSFIDCKQRIYHVRTERAYLGIGRGDYTLAGYGDRIAIERKSAQDFCGTLLGWPKDQDDEGVQKHGHEIDRRGRFKRELATLAKMENKAVIVEATLGQCLAECPQWGKRTGRENALYLYSTYLAWQQEFPIPWIFCDDKEMAAVTAFRILEKFWHRLQEGRRRKKRESLEAARPSLF